MSHSCGGMSGRFFPYSLDTFYCFQILNFSILSVFSSCELIFMRCGCEVVHRFCESLSKSFTLDSGGRAFMFSILLNWNIIVCCFLYDITEKSK